MDPLTAPQLGYLYQDFATAYFFARALAEAHGTLIVNRQDFKLDRFDDLVYRDTNVLVRRQFKHSEKDTKELTLDDFVKNTRLRIDGLVRCHIQAEEPGLTQYRLCTNWRRPSDPDFLNLLEPITSVPSFEGDASVFYRLKSDAIWPEGSESLWQPLKAASGITRQDFVEFANRFTIELECAQTSRDFEKPGPLERCILEVLEQNVGIGRFPNNALDPRRVAAELVLLAYKARTANQTILPEEIERELRLRKDFGRIAQQFPIDQNVYVPNAALMHDLVNLTETHRLLALTGPPGSGKSWRLNSLTAELIEQGHLVAKHYCYLEPGDLEAQRRITTNVLFANLIAELVDAVPQLRDGNFPRYAAGPRELETILPAAVKASTSGRVVLLIDGLDHISRVAAETQALAREETDIIEQLAALKLPAGVSIVIGSQPGAHLEVLERTLNQDSIAHITMPEWHPEQIRDLMERWGIRQALQNKGFPALDQNLVTTVWQRSEGNPLHATYLCRMLLNSINEAQATLPIEVVLGVPPYAGNIANYYEYLLQPLDATTGLIAELLGVIDFGLTEIELRDIFPFGAHRVPNALRRLSPVLKQISAQGGVRVYHESFRRFIVERTKQQGGSVAAALAPIIDWLSKRDFYQDAKTYRFLIPCLRRAAREDEIITLFNPGFVSSSVAAGHHRTAVEANISVAIDIAAEREDWPLLARCTQLLSAVYTCFEEKFDTGLFGQTFCALYGADALAERLLFDGRPTMPRLQGLRLCTLCDDAGAVAPWQEYLDLVPDPQDDNDSDVAEQGQLDTIQGKIRLNGIESIYPPLRDWFSTTDDPDEDFSRAALRIIAKAGGWEVLDRMRGEATITGDAASWIEIELASALKETGNIQRAQELASDLIDRDIPATLAYECVQLGGDPTHLQDFVAELQTTSPKIIGEDVRLESHEMTAWVAMTSIAAHIAPDILVEISSGIKGEGWYRDWLGYVITLAQIEVKAITDPNGGEADLVQALHNLAADIHPFQGHPRACDLYSIWSHVHDSIARGLRLLRTTTSWGEALDLLIQISNGTTTSLRNSPGGPLTSSALMELLLPYCSDSMLHSTITKAIESQLARSERNGEYYENHAEHEMRLAWCLARGELREDARVHWNKAATYLTAYGYRKDISLFDFIESIPQLALTDRSHALEALKRVQPFTDIATNHTDGKETKHLQNYWFKALCEVDLPGALVLLARTLTLDGGRHLWKLESAVEDAVQICRGKVDPLPLNFVQMTLLSDEDKPDSEGKAATIDALLQQDRILGEKLLRVLAAQVSGNDGASGDYGGEKTAPYPLLEQVALNHNIALPPLPASAISSTRRSNAPLPFSTPPKTWVPEIPFFVAEATPLEMLAALRNASKQYFDRKDDYTPLLNGLGYRLLTLIDAGVEHEAVRIIRYIAREYFFSTGANLLADLASGLERHGHIRVAAITWTLAYVYSRGGGGWFLMGGKEYVHWFEGAVSLSSSDAWSTLALEIADILHKGRTHGLTRHLVDLCASMKLGEIGYTVWDAAFEVMARRLPEPVTGYQLFVPYSPTIGEGWSATEAFVYVLISRLTHPEFQRKIAALTGLVTLVTETPNVVVKPLQSALNVDTPLTSCILLLQSLWEAETAPYSITHALVSELQSLCQCNHFSNATIAKKLLERSGIEVLQPSLEMDLAVLSTVSPEREETILSLDWGDRVEHIANIWPNFPSLVTARFEDLWRSAGARERSKDRHEIVSYNPRREMPLTPLWHWENELFECAFHEVLAHLTAEAHQADAAQLGIEDFILQHVVPDIYLPVRAWYSRSIRPALPLPNELEDTISDALPLATNDEYAGWYRCGYYEQQYIAKNDDREAVTGATQVFHGIAFLPNANNAVFGLQLGIPEMRAIWEFDEMGQPSIQQSVSGPMAGLDMMDDNLGRTPTLGLSPLIIQRLELRSVSHLGRLELVDDEQRPAVIFRRWSTQPIGTTISSETPQLSGCDLLMRPDLYERLSSMTPNIPVEITRIRPMQWRPF